MSDAILPPLFQILTGLSFATILAVRFLAAAVLKPVWGRVVAFSMIFVALGNLFMSFGTAKRSLADGVELFALAGLSFFVAAALVAVGLFMAARSAVGVTQS